MATAGVLIRSSSEKRAERRCVETPRRDAGEEARRGGVESGVNCLIQHVQQSFNADSLLRWGGKQTRYQLGIWRCRRGRRRSTAFLEVIQIGKHCFTDKLSLLTMDSIGRPGVGSSAGIATLYANALLFQHASVEHRKYHEGISRDRGARRRVAWHIGR